MRPSRSGTGIRTPYAPEIRIWWFGAWHPSQKSFARVSHEVLSETCRENACPLNDFWNSARDMLNKYIEHTTATNACEMHPARAEQTSYSHRPERSAKHILTYATQPVGHRNMQNLCTTNKNMVVWCGASLRIILCTCPA
jgi:hypothetical protein